MNYLRIVSSLTAQPGQPTSQPTMIPSERLEFVFYFGWRHSPADGKDVAGSLLSQKEEMEDRHQQPRHGVHCNVVLVADDFVLLCGVVSWMMCLWVIGCE